MEKIFENNSEDDYPDADELNDELDDVDIDIDDELELDMDDDKYWTQKKFCWRNFFEYFICRRMKANDENIENKNYGAF